MPRLRKMLVPVLAVSLCVVVGAATRTPTESAAEIDELVQGYAFTRSYLNGDPPDAVSVREVQPALQHIDAWISAVGASVGLADFDGDGRPNETCLVDPRDDSVTVAPAPPERARFAAFPLVPRDVFDDPDTTAPMGCVPADLNEDGYQDVLVFFWGRPPLLYLRLPDSPLGTDAFVPVEVADPDEIWNTTTVNVADVDGDGHLDLIVGNYFPDGARVLDPATGNDPLMEMQDSMSRARNGGINRILLFSGVDHEGIPAPRFTESPALSPHRARAWTLAIGARDLSGDGLPELYFANDFGPDYLLVNRSRPGEVRLEEVRGERDPLAPKSKVLGRGSFKGMGVAFDDLNADGQPDILVSNITTPYGLYESNFAFLSNGGSLDGSVAPYRDESERLGLARSGWAWDIRTGDFNADGRPEVVQATGFLAGETDRWPELQELAMANDEVLRYPWAWPSFRPGDDLSGSEQNPFYARSDDGRFVDIATELELVNPGVSRALAIGDVDRDGRLDFAVGNQWARSTFFRNTGPAGSFLGLQLMLPSTIDGVPRPAIGARAEVTLPDGTNRSGQLYPANGHTGTDAPELYFGLGNAASAGPLEVTITWRDAAGLQALTTTLAPGWHTVLLTNQ